MVEDAGTKELGQFIGQFHGVSLDEVLTEISYLRDFGDTVIAGGSLAYGLGNSLSDLDLLVTGPISGDSPPVPLQHFINSLRVEVWKVGSDFIEDAFERAENSLASDAPLLGQFGDVDYEDELKLLHRIAFGVHLDGVTLEPRVGRTYRAVASNLVIREYTERMRSSALLALLACRAGRAVAAVINARSAIEEALNGALAYRGFPFSGDKWLRDRLDNGASDLAETYEPFRRLPDNPARDAPGFVDSALCVCADLWGVDFSFDALAKEAAWHAKRALEVVEIDDDPLLISAHHGALWGLDEGEAEAWRRLRPDGALEPGTKWRLHECGPEASHLCLRLYEIGLLSLRWSKGVAIAELTPSSICEG
jgi:hypothetical protein